jgi:hypothetical protein
MNEKDYRGEPASSARVGGQRCQRAKKAPYRARAMHVGIVCMLAHSPTVSVLADDASHGAPGDSCRVTLADSLGDASPASRFSLFGSSGLSVSVSILLGPRIEIARSVMLTEIGALINNCKAVAQGVPDCPDAQPLRVEIRPDEGGVPSLSKVIASFELSHDDEPLEFSYESTAPARVLGPGVYFVLFTAVDDDVGTLLQSATDPKLYRAEGLPFGIVQANVPLSYTSENENAAVRVLGRITVQEEDFAGLAAQIEKLARGPQQTLRSLLRTATRAVHFGDHRAARASLDALAWRVWQHWGKSIPKQAALQLLTETKQLLDAIDCSR